jgi:hypothetical protein
LEAREEEGKGARWSGECVGRLAGGGDSRERWGCVACDAVTLACWDHLSVSGAAPARFGIFCGKWRARRSELLCTRAEVPNRHLLSKKKKRHTVLSI